MSDVIPSPCDTRIRQDSDKSVCTYQGGCKAALRIPGKFLGWRTAKREVCCGVHFLHTQFCWRRWRSYSNPLVCRFPLFILLVERENERFAWYWVSLVLKVLKDAYFGLRPSHHDTRYDFIQINNNQCILNITSYHNPKHTNNEIITSIRIPPRSHIHNKSRFQASVHQLQPFTHITQTISPGKCLT